MNPKLALGGAALLGCASVALVIGYFSAPGDRFASCRAENMVDFAALGGPFELTDETGRTVTDAEVINQPSLVYFGYTFCPDVCPLDNLRNAEAAYLLEEKGLTLQPVFVSVDPKRDTPDVLTEFTDAFHPKMIGLTGPHERLKKLTEDYASYFEIKEGQDEEFYLVDHTAYTYVVLPEHGVVDIAKRELSAEDLASRAACLIENA